MAKQRLSTARNNETCPTPSPTARLFVSTEESRQLSLCVARICASVPSPSDYEGPPWPPR
jgi:hypothetical protein